MVDSKEAVMRGGQAEYDNLKARREVINNILITRKEEREIKKKMLYYLKVEEERLNALHLEEEACKLEEAERQKREEAELEKQRQRDRELEERERLRLRKEAVLGKASENPPTKTFNIPGGSRPSDPAPGDATVAAPSAGKYVLWFRRHESSGLAPPAEPDRQGSAKPDDRVPPPSSDRRGSNDRRPTSFGGAGGGSRW